MAVITQIGVPDPVTGLTDNSSVVEEIAVGDLPVYGPNSKVLAAPSFSQLINPTGGHSI